MVKSHSILCVRFISVKELETSWSCSRCKTSRFDNMIGCDGCGEWHHWYVFLYYCNIKNKNKHTYYIALLKHVSGHYG